MKKIIIIGGLLALTCLMAAGVFVYMRLNEGMAVNVFYFDPRTFHLEYERRTVAYDDPVLIVDAVRRMMYEVPRNSSLVSAVPELLMPEDKLFEVRFDPNSQILEANFPALYWDIQPHEEAIVRASLVWTMTELPFVDSVRVLVEGEELLNAQGAPLGLKTRENVLINPPLRPHRSVPRDFILYFVTAEIDGIASEKRTVEVNPDLPQERFIIQELIEGPASEWLVSHIPAGTRVREVRTEAGMSTINLSDEFTSQFGGHATLAELTLRAIVQSIMANDVNVRSIQFLVEGERRENFNGVPGFDALLERDMWFIEASP